MNMIVNSTFVSGSMFNEFRTYVEMMLIRQHTFFFIVLGTRKIVVHDAVFKNSTLIRKISKKQKKATRQWA